jgi:hypothetical protein
LVEQRQQQQHNIVVLGAAEPTTVVEIPQLGPSPIKVYTVREGPACTTFYGNSRGFNKNINFFTGIDHDKDDGYDEHHRPKQPRVVAELYPMGAKYLLPSSPVEPCMGRDGGETTTDPDATTEPGLITAISATAAAVVCYGRGTAFLEPESVPPVHGRARGGLAVSTLLTPITGERLLLGISHCKTPYSSKGDSPRSGPNVKSNQYFSSLYAMASTSPYEVVARSGRFCLGHATAAEVTTNPFARDNLDPLRIDRTYDCPRIHFVSGIAEVVDDPSSVIIAYGVNDCAPRFITVKKAHLVRLRFLDVL